MRKLVLLAALCAACSSTPATSITPPPPPPPPTATSLAIVAGDGQSAPPGTALPIHPAVLIKDASGALLAGVTVSFAVDSGGGSLSATSAVTGSIGVATAGVWTLGAAEGRNTLKVTVGTLAPIRIGALAAAAAGSFPLVTIGTGGGSIVVSQPGALNGFKLDIPGGALGAPLQATVSYSSNASFPRINGVTPVSPIVTIASATPGYAAKPLTLHIPAIVPSNTFPVIVMFDSASGAREVLTTVAWNAAGVSAMVGSLSSANLLGATGAPGSLRRASSGSTMVRFITIAITDSALMADYDTGFRPSVDDWEFHNYTTQLDTSGAGVADGMSATEVWYFATHPSAGKLSNHFVEAPGVELSNRRGLRWVSEVDRAIGPTVLASVQQSLAARVGNDPVVADYNQFLTVRAGFVMGQGSPQPQLIAVEPIGQTAVLPPMIVYKAIGGALYLADPSFPGDASRTLNFTSTGGMQPYVAFGQSNGSPISMGLSSLLPLGSLSANYPSVVDGTIGANDFFSYTLHSKYGVLGDTIWVPDTLRVWVECAACTPVITSPAAPEATASLTGLDFWTLRSGAWTSAGSTKVLGLNETNVTAPSVLTDGLVVSEPGQVVNGLVSQYWMDWKKITLVKVSDTITISTLSASNGGLPPFTLTRQTTGPLPSHPSYTWDFGDGTAKVTANTNAPVQHNYVPGVYTISGQILDVSTQQPLASVTVVDTVKPLQFAWQMDAVTLSSSVPALANQTDTLTQNAANNLLTNIQQNPGSNFIIAADSTSCSTAAFEHFKQGVAGSPVLVAGQPTVVVAASCFAGGSFTMAALGSGSLAGVGPKGSGPALVGDGSGAISSVMSSKNLNGTVTWNLPYSGGQAVYTLTFHAVQVVP